MSITRKPAEEIKYWISYIDCAVKHPRPLPRGKHAYQVNLDTVLEVRDLYHCLYKLYTEESSSVNFREPVNALALGVFTYYDVVHEPICLRTILDRITEGNHYSKADQVLRDVQSIWQNCYAFNGPTSPVSLEAKKCAAALERLQQQFEDDKLAPQADVDHLVEVIEGASDTGILDALIVYFRREDPSMLEKDDLQLDRLKVKHIRAMKEITDRFLAKGNNF